MNIATITHNQPPMRRAAAHATGDALTPTTDQLLDLIKKDPDEGMQMLQFMYGGQLFRFAFKRLHNREEAKDVVAEIYLKVLKSTDEIKGPGAFQTWLFRITRNLCIDILRQRTPESLTECFHKSADAMKLAIPPHGEQSLTAIVLSDAISRLKEDCRKAIILADIQEKPLEEAAADLGITVSVFKSQLYRARKVLRRMLGNSFDELTVCPRVKATDLELLDSNQPMPELANAILGYFERSPYFKDKLAEVQKQIDPDKTPLKELSRILYANGLTGDVLWIQMCQVRMKVDKKIGSSITRAQKRKRNFISDYWGQLQSYLENPDHVFQPTRFFLARQKKFATGNPQP